jgi:polygalacturonase
VPAGTFVSGSVELKSKVTLLLGPGAVLRGSDRLEDYPPNPFHHNEMDETRSLLWAIDQSDIKITGSGVIELVDAPFMDWNRFPQDGMSSGKPMNEQQKKEATVTWLKRPTQPIFFHNCEGLLMEGITIRNSPCWTISASTCRNITFSKLTISNHLQTPNSDGIHCSACQNVIITDCIFSCGDDCIAITGITNWKGISENIVIANCTMVSRSAGIRIGHKASKVRNVVVSNIVMNDVNRGIAIFADEDGWVKDVVMSNLVMGCRIFPGAWWGKGEPLVIATGGNGIIRGVTINQARARAENGIVIVGQKGSISDVELRDWSLELAQGSNRDLFKQCFDIQPAKPIEAPDPAKHMPGLFAKSVEGLRVSNLKCSSDSGSVSVEPITAEVSGLQLSDCKFAPASSR